MKIIMCGPPHSGKSVLISSLYSLMPSDSSQRIIANGDGEGGWSQNPDQMQVQDVRIKSDNTPEEFEAWTQTIKNAIQDIVLVDIGGRLGEDKAPLFDVSDSFIVLSSKPDVVEDWIRFGEKHNCKCIAVLESVLDGTDEIFNDKPYFHACISHLERGYNASKSEVVQKLADLIVTQSGYLERQRINFYKISKEIGCGDKWTASNGVVVRHVNYPFEKANEVLAYMRQHFAEKKKYYLIGAKSNWLASVSGLYLLSIPGSKLSFYDEWTDSYIESLRLEKVEDKECVDLKWKIQETDKAVYIKFYLKNFYLNPEHMPLYKLPMVDENKDLYISGKFPNWFTTSVLSSYSSRNKYFLIPGMGFVCVQSQEADKLGRVTTVFDWDISMDREDMK